MTGMTAEAEIFEQHRRHLTGVAYRITGSWTDAEDIARTCGCVGRTGTPTLRGLVTGCSG